MESKLDIMGTSARGPAYRRMMTGSTGDPQLPERAELLAALSLAIDLGLGQPMEHMLRSCALGVRIADRLGLDLPQRDRIFYATLLSWIGCHADSPELAGVFGDDIGFRADTYAVDQRGLGQLRFMLSHVAAGRPWSERAVRSLAFLATGRATMNRIIRSHCISAGELADHVGVDDAVAGLLGFAFERWDGAGLPNGASGEAIPLEMRIVHLCDTTEVFVHRHGVNAARIMVRERRGTQLDPDLADLFTSEADELTGGMLGDAWNAALRSAPRDRAVDRAELTAILTAMGDFADLKSPYTVGHSRAVADLAEAAGRHAGLDEERRRDLRSAGLVHDLGRMGVSNAVWDKRTPLTESERERVRLHPYYTERILSRVPALTRIAGLAGAHHERLDGSGYTRGVTAESLGYTARVLAAADSYRTSVEPRPHRPALSAADAAARLREGVRELRLDGSAVEAVLSAAGHTARRRTAWPAGLTNREIDLLRLMVRGMSNREIAATLVISDKTVRNHLEHIYAKLGVTNRTSASLFAMRNGIID